MHASTTLLLLVAAGAASAQTVGTEVGFGLRAFSTRSEDIQNWAVVNAHVGAGDNVLEVQRPTASEPDHAFFNGTSKQINNGKARLAFLPPNYEFAFEANIPYKAEGHLVRIESHPGQGTHSFDLANTGFGLGVDLLAFGDRHGFWICPEKLYDTQPEAFVLYYGRNPKKANLPSQECQPVRLQTGDL